MNSSKKRVVALLPMKANSERVKNKNFRNFCGKPLYSWILNSLLAVSEIDQIIINTDAREILLQNGLIDNERIIIRDRKPELCGDLVSMNLIIGDDIENIDSDIYIMTHTTNPLLSSNTINSALHQFQKANLAGVSDSLFTVNKIQTRFYRANGSAVNHDPANLIRTQDLEPWFEENSNMYIFTGKSYQKTNARIGVKPIMFETPAFESIDIDDQDDWDFAVVAASYMQAKNGSFS